MSTTKNIGLELTPENTDKNFKQWRTGIDGETNSNMIKIDNKFKEVDENLSQSYTKAEVKKRFVTYGVENDVMPQTEFAIDSDAINYQIWGNSKQETRSGKNLIPYPYDETTKTENGITFTDNKNGTITANGRATAQVLFSVKSNMPLNKGTYVFSGGTEFCEIEVGIKPYIGAETEYYHVKNNEISFTIEEEGVFRWCNIIIPNDYNANNVIFKPLLDLKIPSPEFPSEIQSVGDKSKNLFNPNIQTAINWEKQNDDSYYCEDPYLPGNFKNLILDETPSQLTISYMVKFSGESSSAGLRFIIHYKDGTTQNVGFLKGDVTDYVLVSVTSNANKVVEYIEKDFGSRFSKTWIKNFQIEEGSTATEYEHYGYKIPISICGKNLFGIDKLKTKAEELGCPITDTTVDLMGSKLHGKIICDRFFKPNTQYTIMYRGHSTDTSYPDVTNLEIRYTDGTKKELYFLTNDSNTVVTTISNKTVLGVFGRYGVSHAIYQLDFFGIFEGVLTKDNYEDGREEKINIYLNEPLRKIGDIYDYIDFQKGAVIRNIETSGLLNGSEDWVEYSDGKTAIYSEGVPYVGIKSDNNLCNYFTTKNVSGQAFFNLANSQSRRIQIGKYKSFSDDVTDIASLKIWLSTHNVEFICQLFTPIEEPINLQPLHLQSGINNIISNTTIQPSNINIKYYQNVSDILDSLKQAIISSGGANL